MRRKKRMRQLEQSFGVIPDTDYFTEDIQGIRLYYEYRKSKALDAFYLDDTTWNDLSLPEMFKQLNATQTIPGEQALYYYLRSPLVDEAEHARRAGMLELIESDPGLRLSLQGILEELGKHRAVNVDEMFDPSPLPLWVPILSVVLMVAMLVSVVGMLAGQALFMKLFFILMITNATFHGLITHFYGKDLATVNYGAGMVSAGVQIAKLKNDRLHALAPSLLEAVRHARSLARLSGVSFLVTSDNGSILSMFFLQDIVAYGRLKRKIMSYREEISAIHEGLGLLDATIAIASYRSAQTGHCKPEIDFSGQNALYYEAEELVHPLLKDPVSNDLSLHRSMLLTGSNASGKSTFVKAALLNAVLAQSICTAFCSRYRASAFHIYSSMAIADNVIEGDSYFIAEIKSIRRIVEAANRGERIFCAIDEVLRGTNTIERIAASTELLSSLARPNVLCLAATHDGELCTLLQAYENAHFEEFLQDGRVLFDYRLKPGPATTRNALKLLAMLGFDPALVASAMKRAEIFEKTGKWPAEMPEA